MHKLCFKCKQIKITDAFYKHSGMKDGHLNKCIECAKRDIRTFRKENEHVRQYDRERYYLNPERKIKNRENVIDWRLNNPDGYAAHTAVSNALRSGKLIQQPCKICGDTEVHAHHKDYSKPLEVEWYCARHHSKQHNPEK